MTSLMTAMQFRIDGSVQSQGSESDQNNECKGHWAGYPEYTSVHLPSLSATTALFLQESDSGVNFNNSSDICPPAVFTRPKHLPSCICAITVADPEGDVPSPQKL